MALKKRRKWRFNATDVYREIEILIHCRHPNIVKFIGYIINKSDEICLLLELLHGETLERFLHPKSNNRVYTRLQRCFELYPKYPSLTNKHSDKTKCETRAVAIPNILSILIQLSDGMSYLAEMKIIHRDLAARNCV